MLALCYHRVVILTLYYHTGNLPNAQVGKHFFVQVGKHFFVVAGAAVTVVFALPQVKVSVH